MTKGLIVWFGITVVGIVIFGVKLATDTSNDSLPGLIQVEETYTKAFAEPISPKAAKKQFIKKCSACHGADGKGTIAKVDFTDGKTYTKADNSLGYLRKIIAEGKKGTSMKSQQATNSAEEMEGLTIYIYKELGKQN